MDKNKLMEQLRKAIREVIQEELGKSSYDATKGISTTELRDKEGKLVGYIKHKNTDGGLVAGGRMGKKAVEKMEKTDENKYSLPAGSMKPKEPVKSQSALEKRFGHLKPGESASLKGDPKKVTPARKKSMEDKAREMGQMDMFTLEEWIGMMEEAGYSLDERNMANKAAKDAYIMKVGRVHGPSGMSLSQAAGQIDREAKQSGRSFRRSIQGDPLANREPGEMKRRVKRGEYDHYNETYTLEEWIGMMEEAGVNLNELSPETLKSYINKAARSATANAHFAGRLAADPDIPGGGVQKAKAAKRLRGIHRATEKLPESYTLEEWMGMMEEAGYSLQENDPYRDRNPNPKPEPGEIPQGDGGMIGYRGIPRGPAPKPDPYRDRNPNPKPEPGEIPQGAGGYHIEERRRINKLSSKKK